MPIFPDMDKLKITRLYVIAGHVAFIFILFLSVFFFKERVVLFDSVFQFFKIVNFEKFNIEAGRYITIVTQVPLLLALKLNLSLKALAVIYSVLFTLVYYSVYILCVHYFKDITAGLTVVMIFTLCIAESFYHTCTETHQALVYSALLYAVINHSYKKPIKFLRIILTGLIVVLCFYSHPVAFFTVLFVLIYSMITKSKWNDITIYFGIGLILLLSIIKVAMTEGNSYEGSIINELFKFKYSFSGICHFYSTRFFLDRLDRLYFWLWILFVLVIAILFLRKEFLKACFILLSTIGFLLITLITYNKGDSNVMMERAFMPLSIFISIPFVNDVLLKSRAYFSLIAFSFFLGILFLGLRRLNFEGYDLTKEVKYIEKLISSTDDIPGNKFLLKRTKEISSRISGSWAFPYCTLVISSMEGSNNGTTLFLYDDLAQFEKYLSDKTGVFLGSSSWLEWDIKSLNHRFFNLPDEPYQVFDIGKNEMILSRYTTFKFNNFSP